MELALNVLESNGLVGIYSCGEYEELRSLFLSGEIDDSRFQGVEGSLLSSLISAYEMGTRIYNYADKWVVPIAKAAISAGYNTYEQIRSEEYGVAGELLRKKLSGQTGQVQGEIDDEPVGETEVCLENPTQPCSSELSIMEWSAIQTEHDCLLTGRSETPSEEDLQDEEILPAFGRTMPQPTRFGVAGMLR